MGFTPIHNKLLRFFGVPQLQQLIAALKEVSLRAPPPPPVRGTLAIAAVLVALAPALILLLPPPGFASELPLAFFFTGTCGVLALLLRNRIAIASGLRTFRSALGITHTAFAVGCIPAVIVILIQPAILAERHAVIAHSGLRQSVDATPQQIAISLGWIVMVALWAAVTEEYIFRGLFVSVIRRIPLLSKQWQRDALAVIGSSALFGLAHMATWGPYAALALVGIGFGFALGYLANGERLAPCILYHFCFDTLSLVLAAYLQHA